jgi:tRNA threonylcarbamoyladenosine biosynthesis protein TsaE
MHDRGNSSDAGTTLGIGPRDGSEPSGAFTAHAGTPAEMKRIGALLARFLRPGDTVLLGGELGAGKTTLTQGLASELGVGEAVTSPTFVLVHSYRTAAGWDLLHADVWRLEHLHEVIDLALPELLEDGAVAVVEWGEIAAPALAPDWLRVTITYGSRDAGTGSLPTATDARSVVFEAFGPSWRCRMPRLSAAWAEILAETPVAETPVAETPVAATSEAATSEAATSEAEPPKAGTPKAFHG